MGPILKVWEFSREKRSYHCKRKGSRRYVETLTTTTHRRKLLPHYANDRLKTLYQGSSVCGQGRLVLTARSHAITEPLLPHLGAWLSVVLIISSTPAALSHCHNTSLTY
ncbi:hypothetical protein J6590_000212 [Homalodisca vitripennis]|nr:hypothetical protein J6590_000212 [Homalodisca vitripennis]